MSTLRRLLFLLFCATPACMNLTPPGILLATSPRGAQVWIDGREAGLATPCQVALEPDSDHRIRFVLAGFQPREVLLRENAGAQSFPGTWADWALRSPNEYTFIPWGQGIMGFGGWAFPLFLPSEDLLRGLRRNQRLHPSRVHVRMLPIE